MSKLKPSAAAKKKAVAACRKSLRAVLKAKREADGNRRAKRPARAAPDRPDPSSEVSARAKAGVPRPPPSQAVPVVRRASGKRIRRRFDPNSWSASPVVRRTNILCLGVSYPCVRSQLRAENADGDILLYMEESVEQTVELVRRNIMTEMDGRDLARCLAIEAANDTLAYCVSMETGARYAPRHLHANFNRASFVQEMKKAWGADVKFRQVILDYFWIPRGSWAMTHWARSFFNTTLPRIVTEGLLDFSSGESNQAQNSAPVEHSTAGFGGGVVYLPFCLHCVKETIAAIDTLSKYYAISFLYKTELKEHALWCATNSIEPEVMQSWFGKAINQEDVYCTFSPHEVLSSADDAHLTKDEVLRVLRGIEDFRDVRMIKLQALRKFDPDFNGSISNGILGVDKGGFVGLKKAHDVERGFDMLRQRKKVVAGKTTVKKALSDSEKGLTAQKGLTIQKVTSTRKQVKMSSTSSIARKKAPTSTKKPPSSRVKRKPNPTPKAKENDSIQKAEDCTVEKSDSDYTPQRKVTTSTKVIDAECAADSRVRPGAGTTREVWGIDNEKFPLEIETLWHPHPEGGEIEIMGEEEIGNLTDSQRIRQIAPSHLSVTSDSSTPLPTIPNETESCHLVSACDGGDNTKHERENQFNSLSIASVITPSPHAPERADVAIAEHSLAEHTSVEQCHKAQRKQERRMRWQPPVCSLQSLPPFSPNEKSQGQQEEAPQIKPRHHISQGLQRGVEAHADAADKSVVHLRRASCGNSVLMTDSWRRESRSLNDAGTRLKVNLLGGTSCNSSPPLKREKSSRQDSVWEGIEKRVASTKDQGEEPHQLPHQSCACGGKCEGAGIARFRTELDKSEESALLLLKMHSSMDAPNVSHADDSSSDTVPTSSSPLTVAGITSFATKAKATKKRTTNVNAKPVPAKAKATKKRTTNKSAASKKVIDDRFHSLLSELCSHRDKTGSLRVTSTVNRRLYVFMNHTRKEYSKYREGGDSKLTQEMVKELERIGFWEGTKVQCGRKKRKRTTLPPPIHETDDDSNVAVRDSSNSAHNSSNKDRSDLFDREKKSKGRKHSAPRTCAIVIETPSTFKSPKKASAKPHRRGQQSVTTKPSDDSFAPSIHSPPSSWTKHNISYSSFDAVRGTRVGGLPKKTSQVLSPFHDAFDSQTGHRSHYKQHQSYSTSISATEGMTALPRRLGVGVECGNDPPTPHHYHPFNHQCESGSIVELATTLALCNAAAAASPLLVGQPLSRVNL